MFDKIIKSVAVIALAIASIGLMIGGIAATSATANQEALSKYQLDKYKAAEGGSSTGDSLQSNIGAKATALEEEAKLLTSEATAIQALRTEVAKYVTATNVAKVAASEGPPAVAAAAAKVTYAWKDSAFETTTVDEDEDESLKTTKDVVVNIWQLNSDGSLTNKGFTIAKGTIVKKVGEDGTAATVVPSALQLYTAKDTGTTANDLGQYTGAARYAEILARIAVINQQLAAYGRSAVTVPSALA